ncbi:LD-carboxypeptidase [Sphingobacteriales bacterium UPWRP_1]|nr:LD-carboxypeptidase [Sphingobacteriales bacterium TSM_CSS]PSJ74013.1 LD-carboxypeptidase [Sphingobacteriales bacterium UPWRP_1]
MIVPPLLQKGNSVALLSTARKILPHELAPALPVFEEWGLQVVLGKTLHLECHQFAGTEEQRLADLQQALDNDQIKAIFCARGGYGTAQIIDRLDFTKFARCPKWIVGYSDVTVLHSHLHTRLRTATLHATMPINFAGNTPQALQTLQQALFEKPPGYTFAPHELNRPGIAKGQVVGGNLSLLYALIGTPSDINTRGKILFIEDLDEYLYHIDRMMNALFRSGKLHRLAGLLIGGMTNMKDNAVPFGEDASQIIARYVKPFGFPVAFGFPAGHMPDNRALVLGKRATLTVDTAGCGLEYLS